MLKRLCFFVIGFIFVVQAGSAYAGFMPYGRIFKAVKDDRTYLTQADDSRLQLKLHKSLLLSHPSTLVNISTYVYLGHCFLVGEVGSEDERAEVINSAQEVSGTTGVSYFLPVSKETGDDGPSALEIKLKAMLEPDYPSSKLAVKVVQRTIVVLGVLTAEEQTKAMSAIQGFSEGAEIINFIQTPTPAKSKIERRRPLRNLFN